MAATFGQGPVMPAVATLPTASSNTNRMLVQGGKLWFSDGTNWIDLGGGGGGGLAWSTVNANTAMTAGNGYVVEGARDMTLPATVPAGAEFVVYAATAAVRIVSNGNVIAGVGSGNDLTIAMNETAHLVGRSSGNLEIV